jgi:hypothetical protein
MHTVGRLHFVTWLFEQQKYTYQMAMHAHFRFGNPLGSFDPLIEGDQTGPWLQQSAGLTCHCQMQACTNTSNENSREVASVANLAGVTLS